MTDVSYNDTSRPSKTYTVEINGIAEYVPGSFYKRELPCLMSLLDNIDVPLGTVIVDGHVWLTAERPGLGHYLYEELGRSIPIVGIAKRHFVEGIATEVLRGQSRNPLYVTEDGFGLQEACAGLRNMHGPHRIPTLLKQVDGLSRGR